MEPAHPAPAAPTLLASLLQDRPAVGTDAAAAVRTHLGHRSAWYADLTGSLVLPDTALAAAGRTVPAGQQGEVEVVVEIAGGAGGLTALAGRATPGLRVVGVVSALRDLDDLAGNARRVAAAAGALEGVVVRVELPDVPGWVRAVEVVEAAGLEAQVSTAGDAWSDPAAARRLAERLSVLVEADLPFAVAPGTTVDGSSARAVLALAMLVEALVDGAEPAGAAELLLADPVRVRAGLHRWDDATAARVRRRLRSVAAAPGRTAADLVELEVLDRRDA